MAILDKKYCDYYKISNIHMLIDNTPNKYKFTILFYDGHQIKHKTPTLDVNLYGLIESYNIIDIKIKDYFMSTRKNKIKNILNKINGK
jgi:hypothetical protein